jgi:hypothetical protein
MGIICVACDSPRFYDAAHTKGNGYLESPFVFQVGIGGSNDWLVYVLGLSCRRLLFGIQIQ